MIGGTSAEMTLKTVKLASTRWLDTLPTSGSKAGHAIRDLEMEQKVLELSRTIGIGAQFGGKYFCHDVRVIRLPRHGASLPVGIGVSCSADRQILAKITPDGVFLEQLETDPAKYLPETTDEHLGDDAVAVDLNRPMAEIRAAAFGVSGEDAADADRHDGGGARHRARQAEGAAGSRRGPAGVYQGPSGVLCGAGEDSGGLCHRVSFGPTTAGRMDSYVRGVPGGGRVAGDAGEGQPLEGGEGRLQGEWRVLSGQSSAGRRRGWRRTASARWRCWSIRNSAWKRCGGSRWRISRRSS